MSPVTANILIVMFVMMIYANLRFFSLVRKQVDEIIKQNEELYEEYARNYEIEIAKLIEKYERDNEND